MVTVELQRGLEAHDSCCTPKCTCWNVVCLSNTCMKVPCLQLRVEESLQVVGLESQPGGCGGWGQGGGGEETSVLHSRCSDTSSVATS